MILVYFIFCNSVMAAMFMPQVPPSMTGFNTEISTSTSTSPWRYSNPPKVYENTVLPPAQSYQARSYLDIQRRLQLSAPERFTSTISSINVTQFKPFITIHRYLNYLKFVLSAYKAMLNFHDHFSRRHMNILVIGREDGLVALALRMLTQSSDQVTLLNRNTEALITARSNFDTDGKGLFLDKIHLYAGNLSLFYDGFDLIVDLEGTSRNYNQKMHQLRDKLAIKGYLVQQRGDTIYLQQLQSDGNFSTIHKTDVQK